MWRKWADIFFWLGISAYFGGLITLGVIVAPAVFTTSRSAHLSMPGIAAPPLEMGGQVGGEIFGEILKRFGILEAAALGLMLAGIGGWIFSHRNIRRSTFILLSLWMLAAVLAALDIAWLQPKVWSLRESVRQQAPTQAVGAAWPDRAEFDRLHSLDESMGHVKVYTLFAMVLIAAWRGQTSRHARPEHSGDMMRRVMSNDH